MTFEEVVINALGRMIDFTQDFPSSRQPMFRRIATRQQQLYSFASKANPDYYGACGVGGFDANGCLDLRDLVNMASMDQAAGIQFLSISDPGASALAAGDEVHLVSIADQDGEIAPRVTLRDFIFRGVGADMDDVTSISVWYSKIPDMVATDEDGSTTLQMLEQHQELLIIDLTKQLLQKTIALEPAVKTAALATLTAEEEKAMQDYLEDINAFAIGQSHRFSEPAPTATR